MLLCDCRLQYAACWTQKLTCGLVQGTVMGGETCTVPAPSTKVMHTQRSPNRPHPPWGGYAVGVCDHQDCLMGRLCPNVFLFCVAAANVPVCSKQRGLEAGGTNCF